MNAYSTRSPALAVVAKKLSPDAFERFVAAANQASATGADHNACIKAGWATVNKDDPGAGDVHVDAPMGGKKPKKDDIRALGDKVKDDEDVEKAFDLAADIVKVDECLGLVMGWAIVCKKDGADYFDVQGDHIPETAMLKAAADFMQHSRVAKEMHAGDQVGDVVFAWPMTTEMAKALGIETRTTGLLIAMKPAAEVLTKFKDGTYTGFSIGGMRVRDEDVQ